MEALPVTPKLPLPLRQVDKLLAALVEKAVDLGEKKRKARGHLGEDVEETGTAVQPSALSEPLPAVRCIALSSDERHVFAGLASGRILAVSSTTGSTIASLNITEGPINAIAQVSMRPVKVVVSLTAPGNKQSESELGEGENDEGEAVASKVLVVAAGDQILFYKVVGVLEDNAFVHFATAQLPRVIPSQLPRVVATQLPPVTQTEAPGIPQAVTDEKLLKGGAITALGVTPDAGLFWALAHDGALAVFPMTSPPPQQEFSGGSPPVSQLTSTFCLPAGSAAQAAGFGDLHSSRGSFENSFSTSVTPQNEQIRCMLRTVRVREADGAKPSNPAGVCELYVWWEGRNRILMYEVPCGQSGTAIKKGVLGVPKKAREWTMPHALTRGVISADGSLMAVGMRDGTAMLLDLHLGLTHRLFNRLDGAITGLAFTGQSAHQPPEGLLVVSTGGELKAHQLAGGEPGEPAPVAVRKGVTEVACVEGTSRALLFTNDARPVLLIDVSTGSVFGSIVPGEGFALSQKKTTEKRENERTEQRKTGTAEDRNGGMIKEKTRERAAAGADDAEASQARLWAFLGGHVLVQTAYQNGGQDVGGQEGGVSASLREDSTGAVPSADPQPPSGTTRASEGDAAARAVGTSARASDGAAASLVFHSMHSAALLPHPDRLAGLFGGPQMLERMLHDSEPVKGRSNDVSRRQSMLQSSPRSKPRHLSSVLRPSEAPDSPGRAQRCSTSSRHVSIQYSSCESPRAYQSSHASPRSLPIPREVSLVGGNTKTLKPLPWSQASTRKVLNDSTVPTETVIKPYNTEPTFSNVNKPSLTQGQLSLTHDDCQRGPRESEAPSVFSLGDLTNRSSAYLSPRKGTLRPGGSPKGRIEGLPSAPKEAEKLDVGYREEVPSILTRLSARGGGRFVREQRVRQRREEMLQELATNKVATLNKIRRNPAP